MTEITTTFRAGYEESKRWSALSGRTHVLSLVLGLAALFVPAPWAYGLAVLTLGAEVAAWFFRMEANRIRVVAVRGHSLALMESGLDVRVDPEESARVGAELQGAVSRFTTGAQPGRYFASGAAPGAARLRELLAESAFWSAHLFACAARSAARRFGLLVAALVCATFATFLVGGEAALLIARCLLILLGAASSLELLETAIVWSRAAARVNRISARLDARPRKDKDALMDIFCEYFCVVSATPLIPTRVYEAHRSSLEAAWATKAAAA